MGVVDQFSFIETFVNAEELVVFSVKFDPHVICAREQLLSVQSIFGLQGLLRSLEVYVGVTWQRVHILELDVGLGLFDLDRINLSKV